MHTRHRRGKRSPCWRGTSGIADREVPAPRLHPVGSSLLQKSKCRRMRRRAKSKIRLRVRRGADELASPATRLAIRAVRWDDLDLLPRRLPMRHRKTHPPERGSAPQKRYSEAAAILQEQPCTIPSAAADIRL